MAKTLHNRSRRAQTYNLPHERYCADGTCRCVPVTQQISLHDPRSGEIGTATRQVSLAASIHFPAGATAANLPDTITSCDDVAAALARRELVELKSEKRARPPADKPTSEPQNKS